MTELRINLADDTAARLQSYLSKKGQDAEAFVRAAVREKLAGVEHGRVHHGSAADLAGSLQSDIPKATLEQELDAAQAYVVRNYLGHDA